MSERIDEIIRANGGNADLLRPFVEKALADVKVVTREDVAETVAELKKDPGLWAAFEDRRPVSSWDDLDSQGEAAKRAYIESKGLDAFLDLLRAEYSQ